MSNNIETTLEQMHSDSAAEVQIDQKKLRTVANFFIKSGYSEEESEALAYQTLIAPPQNHGTGFGSRDLLAPVIKDFMANRYREGQHEVRAVECKDHLSAHHNYEATDAKGIGDLLGGHGFFLEPNGKSGKKKAYLIPNPDKYSDWYQSKSLQVPPSYYSREYAKALAHSEVWKQNSKLLN